jgi:hypothetical protein
MSLAPNSLGYLGVFIRLPGCPHMPLVRERPPRRELPCAANRETFATGHVLGVLLFAWNASAPAALTCELGIISGPNMSSPGSSASLISFRSSRHHPADFEGGSPMGSLIYLWYLADSKSRSPALCCASPPADDIRRPDSNQGAVEDYKDVRTFTTEGSLKVAGGSAYMYKVRFDLTGNVQSRALEVTPTRKVRRV